MYMIKKLSFEQLMYDQGSSLQRLPLKCYFACQII